MVVIEAIGTGDWKNKGAGQSRVTQNTNPGLTTRGSIKQIIVTAATATPALLFRTGSGGIQIEGIHAR